jgi:serine/threonine protein kinase
MLHAWSPNPIVHGDIKCVRTFVSGLRLMLIEVVVLQENILIGADCRPLITDFGLSKVHPHHLTSKTSQYTERSIGQILEDVTGTPFTQSKGISDSYRWFAPEICSHPGILSPQSDMFSFAMTILEVRIHPMAGTVF